MKDTADIDKLLKSESRDDAEAPLLNQENQATTKEIMDTMTFIGEKITEVSTF